MKFVLENRDGFVVAKFIEGPRQGFLASQNIGTTDEQPLLWPERGDAISWLQSHGHQEHVFDALAYLRSQDTRELMDVRDRCYRFEHSGYDVTENNGNCFVSLEHVLAELSTREHIPNKAEAKAIRQQKAHAQRHR